jgi:ATP/maltotriose-dependent transcriptional regulator MalT
VQERHEELIAIEQSLERVAHGHGATLLIEGPAGIGKTTVLSATQDFAAGRGMSTLAVRGTPLERSDAFGGARRLLGSVDRRFEGQAAAARGVLEDEAGTPEPMTARLLGLVAVVEELCDQRGPVILAADDAHWLDDPTLDLLALLSTRVEDLPLLLAVAARTGPGELGPALARLASGPEVMRLQLAPLARAGVQTVLSERLGSAVDDELAEAALQATGGNPWFVTALADQMARDPDARREPAVRALAPEAIAATVEARIAGAAAEGPDLARALLVLGDGAEPRNLAALAEVPFERALEVLDALADAGILSSARPPQFAHGIVRAAVYRRTPDGRLALDNRRAAALLADEHAAAERIASHLLESEPAGEAWAAETLLEAASTARSRGSPERAAELLDRALAEPPAPDRRTEVLARLGAAELEAGHAGAAAAHLSHALADPHTHDIDSIRRLAQAEASSGDVEQAVGTLESAIARDDLAREERLVLTADLAGMATVDPRMVGRARQVLAELGQVDASSPGGRLVLAARSRQLMFEGSDIERTAQEAERALGDGVLAAESSVWIVWSYAVYALIVADRLDAAIYEIDRSLTSVIARASVGWYCVARILRSDAELRAGRVNFAVADIRGAFEAGRDNDLDPLAIGVGLLVATHLERGELEEAEGVLVEYGFDGDLPEHLLFTTLMYERGRLRLEKGDTDGALDDLLELQQREQRLGASNANTTGWRIPAVRALLRVGDLKQARKLALEHVELTVRWPCPRSHANAELLLGLTEEDRVRAEEHFTAAAQLAGTTAQLVGVEALIELGRTIRQQGERARARDPLRSAYKRADELGCVRLVRHAEAELRAARGRPPKRATADDELTPSELRIAELAAGGTSNREIAATLFLSVRTVETHLTSAYRRLGISSRHELADALAQAPTGPEGAVAR